MVKHIVMWKLKAQAEGRDKAENLEKMRDMLKSMEDSIREIQQLEVGTNMPGTDAAHDIVLTTEFRSMTEFDIYREHPEHKKVAEFIKKVVMERAAVDYTCK